MRSRVGAGVLVGLLAAGVAIGVGEAAAALVRPAAAPLVAVGNRAVTLTPGPVKEWAIRTFGTSDKTVLLVGIAVVLAICAAGFGVLALRRMGYGLAGVAAFALLGCYCALTAPDGGVGDAVPTVVGAIAAAIALRELARTVVPATPGTGGADGTDGAARPDRRRFLQGSLAAAVIALLGGFGGRAVLGARFDAQAARRGVVLPPPASPAPPLPPRANLGKSGIPWHTANAEFYRVDTALSVPQIDPDDWTLRVHGMVEHPFTLSYAELLERPLIERWVTLCCVSNLVGGNLIGNATFLGARLADVLVEAGLRPGVQQLLMTSADGMTIGCPSAVALDGRDSMLAVGMNGVPLPVVHGFPVRVVVPGLYGYVSACKWVVDIEATTFADKAYWVQDGYRQHPAIELESRIDRPRDGQQVAVGQPATIAGVAWDQHVGVSAVEVQVSGPGADTDWLRARLGNVPSTDTWRQWALTWTPPAAGTYTLRVRAVDATGRVQTSRSQPPFPGGATGLNAVSVRAD